ncbi:MAG: hypothetical protein LBF63_03555 [Treponema sp.]|nr:hypothetical protein [Treponema sp.]
MKKVAIFVEGQTEQIFADELVRHIFGHAKVDIEKLQFSGREGSRRIRIIRSTNTTESIGHPSFVLKQVYQSVGNDYNKKKWEVKRTEWKIGRSGLICSCVLPTEAF